jgi:hypothetical protein
MLQMYDVAADSQPPTAHSIGPHVNAFFILMQKLSCLQARRTCGVRTLNSLCMCRRCPVTGALASLQLHKVKHVYNAVQWVRYHCLCQRAVMTAIAHHRCVAHCRFPFAVLTSLWPLQTTITCEVSSVVAFDCLFLFVDIIVRAAPNTLVQRAWDPLACH